MSINGDVINPQEALSCEAGDLLQIFIKVCNILESPLRQLNLSIRFYQDYQNGTCNYKLDSRLATAGSTSAMLPNLEPQGNAQHSCNVIFFTPGQYKIDIQCSAPECLSSAPSFMPTGHIWRFIPPVEVNVNS